MTPADPARRATDTADSGKASIMTALQDHPAVADYLARLRSAATRLPRAEADELLSDIEGHFAAAEAEGIHGDAAIANLIERLGPPEALVAEMAPAQVRPPGAAPGEAPVAPPPAVRHWETPTVACLLAAEVLALTVIGLPLAVLAWVAGLILLVLARRWSRDQKVQAGLVLGTGFPVALLVILGGTLSLRVTQCSSTSTGAETCTTGPPVWVTAVAIALGVAYGAAQVILARRLLASVGEHGPRAKGLR